MTLELPAPLVAAEVDLTDFAYMELDVRKLRDSRFGAEVSGDAFRAGVMLWCASWHQVPAGSVPDDDIELANLAGYGRFVKEWKKSRDQALQGFVKCSDGRLYHETVAEKANAAWNAKLQHHYDRACDRLRKANKARKDKGLELIPELTFEAWNETRISARVPMERAEASAGIPPNADKPSGGIPPENALKGRGNGEGEGEGDSLSEAKASGASAPPEPGPAAERSPLPATPPSEPAPKTAAELTKAELWTAGKSLLEAQGMPAKQCGTFVGKLVKDFGDEIVVDSVRAAVLEQPADAASWLKAACQARAGQRKPVNRQQAIEDENHRVAANWAAGAPA